MIKIVQTQNFASPQIQTITWRFETDPYKMTSNLETAQANRNLETAQAIERRSPQRS